MNSLSRLQDYINKNNFNKQCTIWHKTSVRNSIPCSICKGLLHQKCCLVRLKNFSTLDMIKVWSCQKCWHDALPFQSISNNELKDRVITETPHAMPEIALNSLRKNYNFSKIFNINENKNSNIENFSNISCDYYDRRIQTPYKKHSQNNHSLYSITILDP